MTDVKEDPEKANLADVVIKNAQMANTELKNLVVAFKYGQMSRRTRATSKHLVWNEQFRLRPLQPPN